MKLKDYSEAWEDTEAFHDLTNLKFEGFVNSDEKLKEHRDFVENHVYGFGQRSFWWLWKLIMDELPKESKMLEIGLFKGATVSLWKMLNSSCKAFAVSPMDGEGLDWKDDYLPMIKHIHDRYKQTMPTIIKGLSEDEFVISKTLSYSTYDCVYIDGGHERKHIDNDLTHYAPMVKSGGFLVIDDAASFLHMPFGYFQGIIEVSEGLRDYMEVHKDEWQFIFNVVHLMVYKKK